MCERENVGRSKGGIAAAPPSIASRNSSQTVSSPLHRLPNPNLSKIKKNERKTRISLGQKGDNATHAKVRCLISREQWIPASIERADEARQDTNKKKEGGGEGVCACVRCTWCGSVRSEVCVHTPLAMKTRPQRPLARGCIARKSSKMRNDVRKEGLSRGKSSIPHKPDSD